MATDVRNETQPSVTKLVGGIITDTQDLMTQQLSLFRNEIKRDITRSWQAGSVMALGLGIGLIAGVVLVFALAHLVEWSCPFLPLWGCYLLIGAVTAVIGGAIVWTGQKQFDSFNPMPDKSIQAMQENVECLTNTRT